ncbi:MAG: HK97 family phage prohead protease [Roseibium sp.]|nr:HK97 family phage prohead protease [Roseibium sp.]
MVDRPSIDELFEKRSGSVKSTDRGDAIVKVFKEPASWDSETRSANFVMSAQAVDRVGDVVRTAGLDTSEFEKNPVGLLFHASRSWPVGQWSELRKIKGRSPRLEGRMTFLEEGTLDEADKAANLVQVGVLRACSIGFMPKEWEWILDEEGRNTYGIDFKESELIECSIVPVPAHPAALVKQAEGDMQLCKSFLEEILDEYAKTPEGLIVPRAEYEKSYFAVEAKEGPVSFSMASGKSYEMVVAEKHEDLPEVLDPDVQVSCQDAVGDELSNKDGGEKVTLKLGIQVDEEAVQRAAEEAVESVFSRIKNGVSELFKVRTTSEPEERIEPKVHEPRIVKGSSEEADAALLAMKSSLAERQINI